LKKVAVRPLTNLQNIALSKGQLAFVYAKLETMNEKKPNAKFSTLAIHAGQEPEASTGAVSVPIYQTSTYAQEGIGKHKGFEYARTQNPTRLALEKNLAALENGKSCFAFASGMAAINAVMTLLKAGDHVIVSDNTYGGTFRLFDKILKKFGLEFSYVDTREPQNVEDAVRPETRMVFVETPTNPVMSLTDLQAVAEITKRRGLRLVVDNTFMSPYFQRPIELGADIVVHSTTKYLNGHSDSIGGAVILNEEEDAKQIAFIQNAAGAILSPMDSWLVMRGTKTLAVRMRQHDENGRLVAQFLSEHPKVQKVYYPGLKSHPQYELARKQMMGFGGMLSFETGSLENAGRVLEGVKLCTLGESLGGVESLISHPATMTHASVPESERTRLGITDGLVRISVGIEDVEDLIEDIDNALSKIE
jgi:cystathionine gamma-lyase/cystathionine beta-lyase/cystathionine gamma-lyase/homocysteine desulfhydrase